MATATDIHMASIREERPHVALPPVLASAAGVMALEMTEQMGYMQLAMSEGGPIEADLTENIEARFTEAITAKAAELGNNPINIYNWVRNNVEFAPTYGSIQGADMCMQTLECNAFDTASLLIAMLRTSGIPARYAYGTVEMDINKFMNWTGGFTNTPAALDFAMSGGIPTTGLQEGGVYRAARLEHVWVEAWVDYIPSYGAIQFEGDTWIPLDPSFKQYEYSPWMDIANLVPFRQTEYLSSLQEYGPVEYYQNNVQDYLDANISNSVEFPEPSVATIKSHGQIIERKSEILPSTLPYKVRTTAVRSSSMSGSYNYSVSFNLSDTNSTGGVTKSYSLSEIAGKRITLSYLPASASDEQLLNEYGGNILDVPAYLMNIYPAIKIDGTITMSGSPVTLGADQMLSMKLTKPSGAYEVVTKELVAGGYYAICINIQGINEQVAGKRNGALTMNVYAGKSTLDDLTGEYLSSLAYSYFMAIDKRNSAAAGLFNVKFMRQLSESIVSLPLKPKYLYSVPVSVSLAGIEVDVDLEDKVVASKDRNSTRRMEYLELIGLESSFQEHHLFEFVLEYASVSTIKALQKAYADGIPVHKINSANLEEVLQVAQVDEHIKSDVRNAVNAGMEVTLPERNVAVGDWNGAGYIIWNPATGAGAYMISGGLNGGASVDLQDVLMLTLLLVLGTAFEMLNALADMIAGNAMAYNAESSIGEIIVAKAEQFDKDKEPYKHVDCSELVRRSHSAAGICIDGNLFGDWKGCQNSLTGILEINQKGKGGAEIHYEVAGALCMYGSIKTEDTDKLMKGDIIYFDDPDYYKNPDHEGIVVKLANNDGTIEFVHSMGGNTDGYARRGNINFTKLTYPENTVLLSSCKGKSLTPCLAATVFKGYGTIRNHPSLCGQQ